MKIISLIPARGGSKGIPKKNIAQLGGKPLIAWTIEASLRSRYINETYVTSDSEEILKIADAWGAQVIKRPKFLALDKTKAYGVISHALKKIDSNADVIIYLQPTSPLRKSGDIDMSIKLFIKKK